MNINQALPCATARTVPPRYKESAAFDLYGEQAKSARAPYRGALSLDSLEAQSTAVRARINSTLTPAETSAISKTQALQTEKPENTEKSEKDFHWQTFAYKEIPSSEAPDYSTWDKEEAYCDIMKRYNLLNLLTPEKARELGLSEAYKNMTSETYNLLYGCSPSGLPSKELMALDTDLPQRMNRKVYCDMYGIESAEEYEKSIKREVASMYDSADFGAWGIDSTAAKVYTKLSQFDLTDNKKNLVGVMPGALIFGPKPDFEHYGEDPLNVDFNEYFDYYGKALLRQAENGTGSINAYNNHKKWARLMREMYDLMVELG